MNDREREAVRYLGYGAHAVDEGTLLLIRTAFDDLEQVAEKRAVCRVFDLKTTEYPNLQIGNLTIRSGKLYKNLLGCEKVALFATTLGIGVDRMIQKASIRNMANAVVIQACAATLLEEYCDEVQEELAAKMRGDGYYLRPRFSPGYGDFDILHQKDIVRMLDCAKTIGLTLTESCMMVPTKSVTALIGISDNDLVCHKHGCEICEKTDCIYRRGTE